MNAIYDNKYIIYVSNLGDDYNKDDIHNLFDTFGLIKNIDISYNDNSKTYY